MLGFAPSSQVVFHSLGFPTVCIRCSGLKKHLVFPDFDVTHIGYYILWVSYIYVLRVVPTVGEVVCCIFRSVEVVVGVCPPFYMKCIYVVKFYIVFCRVVCGVLLCSVVQCGSLTPWFGSR